MISVYCVKIPHSSTIFIWLKQCSFYKYFPHHFAVKLLQLTIILRLIYRQFRTMWLTATCSCLEQWLGWNWLGWNWLKQASGEVREENDWSWTKWALWVAGPYWGGQCEWLDRASVATMSVWTVLAWALWVAGPHLRGHYEWLDRTGVAVVSDWTVLAWALWVAGRALMWC